MKPTRLLPFAGSARTPLLLASLSCCLVASATEVSHRYYRFTPLKLRNDATSNSIQLAEFTFLHLGAAVPSAGIVVTNPGGRFSATQAPANLVDGQAGTKWLDFHKLPLIFDFGTATTIDGYRFTTGNDATERDPLRWVLEGSNDATTWTLVDYMSSDFATPAARGTDTTDILLLDEVTPYVMNWTAAESSNWDGLAANWDNGSPAYWNNVQHHLAKIATAGTLTVTEPVTVRAIDFMQPGITVAGGTLTLSGVPRFTAQGAAEISSVIAGNVGLSKIGPETLTVSGANTFTGAITALGGTLVLGGSNATTSGAVVHGGRLEVTGTNAYGGATTVWGGGSLAFSGSASKTVAGGLTVGDSPGPGVMTVADTATVAFNGTPLIGTSATGNGAVRQSGGTATYSQDAAYLTLGNSSGSYGSYELSGGAMATPAGSGIRIGWNSTGNFTQSGGSLSCGRWLVIGGSNARGTATFTGGTASVNATYRVILGDQANGEGIFNLGTLAGGDAVFSCLRTSTTDGSFVLGSNATGSGVLNLNSGVLKLHARVYRTGATGTVHFNGGTLRAGVNNVELMNNTPTLALVHRGGVVIDTNGLNASMSTHLVPALADGIYPAGATFPITAGGAGYIGAPRVTITTTGGGSRARANAIVENGAVTGVVMTCPGENYVEGDTITFNFSGGGPATAATNSEHVLTAADLAANGTGGLTKAGAGTFTLTGSSSYTGPTAVTAGTFAANGILGATPLTVAAGATLSGNLNTAGPVIVNGILAPGATVGTATGSSSLELAGGSTYALQIADWPGSAGFAYDTASFQSLVTTATATNKLTIHVDGTGMTGFTESPRAFTLVTTPGAPAGFTADNWQVAATNFPGTGTWALSTTATNLVLTYTPATGGYGTWIGGFTGLSDVTADGDPDGDGILNVVEYALNGNPGTAATGILPTALQDGANFAFTFVRRAESKNDTTQVFQHGSTPGSWTAVAVPATSAGMATVLPDTPAAGLETVTISVPSSGPRHFGRLVVTRP